eukprot:1196014-Prorocentrum_minimum.AAC.7
MSRYNKGLMSLSPPTSAVRAAGALSNIRMITIKKKTVGAGVRRRRQRGGGLPRGGDTCRHAAARERPRDRGSTLQDVLPP